jgi:IS5 family transposase
MRVKTGSDQSNLFDILSHADTASQRKSSLDRLAVINWEAFRPVLEEHLAYGDQKKGGRTPWCPVLMLKVLVLQRFFDLSDEETEFQIMDRFSFLRFLGLRPGDGVPDHATIWSFKERLGEDGMLAIFDVFNEQLRQAGLIASCGKIIDASFIEAPKQRNRRHENEQIKRGEVPERIAKKPRRACQKDLDARWTQKGGVSYYGYKNHIKMDAASKLIDTFTVTHAAVHDSQPVEKLLCERDRGRVLWADTTAPTPARALPGYWIALACSPTSTKKAPPGNHWAATKSAATKKRAAFAPGLNTSLGASPSSAAITSAASAGDDVASKPP